ncbi:hypothetical protein BsWGS_11734 [Bradybaena similaris]
MASTSSRRVGSHRTHERPSSKSDDPWCLICGVNLALDGRTFTVVSPHQNSELCDVFLRVLAMTFTQENAFVNVCNRCERQLKRLGRTTSIAMARQEGRKFREQVEGNVAKHGLQGVALGDFRNLNMTAAAVSSKTDNSASSGGTMRRGNTVDESSSARKGREMYSRSNSSVRVEDKESGKRGAYNRDLSAPERKVQARELHSTVNESSDKNKEVRRGTRPGNQTAAVERTASFKAISDDKRSKSSIPSQRRVPPTRDGKPSIQKMNSVDLPQKSGKVSTTTFAREASKTEPSKSQAERKQHPGKPDNNKQEHRENNIHNDSWELSSGELNPFAADIELESSNVEAGRAFDDHARRQIQHAFHEYQARDVTVLTDDDQFIQTERAVLMESSQSSHSSNEAVDDDEKPRADAHGSSPKFCVGTDGQTLPIGDEHERAAEQLTAEEENRDRARRLRVTFSENVGDDVNDETLVREHSGSSQARQDSASVKTASDKGDLQDSSPLIAGTEDNREEEVKAVYDFNEQLPGGDLQVKAGDDTGESVRDAAEGEGDDWSQDEHGLIETDRLQQEAAASEAADLVFLELTTSSSFVRHSPDSEASHESPQLYSVSKVIHVTHLPPPVQLDDVDLKGDEEQTFVKDASDQNGSQVSIEPMHVQDASAAKSEASPLIDKDEVKGDKAAGKGKDSKFKDQQPGLPCCTIL